MGIITNYITTVIFLVTVPTPTVSVTALSNQIVGQSLMLECNVTIARGINNRSVDIMWSVSNGTVIKTINGAMNNTSQVYTDIYTIPVLSEDDDEEDYVCEGVLNASTLVMSEDSITLNVTSEYSTAYSICCIGVNFLREKNFHGHLL